MLGRVSRVHGSRSVKPVANHNTNPREAHVSPGIPLSTDFTVGGRPKWGSYEVVQARYRSRLSRTASATRTSKGSKIPSTLAVSSASR